MKSFDLFVDSSANLPAETVKRTGIKVIPYHCTVNGEDMCCYPDPASGEERPFSGIAKEYYARMRGGAECKTSLIGAQTFADAMRPSLLAGRDVLLITISAGVSGTYRQARCAKEMLDEEFGGGRVFVADSANASLGQGILAIRAAEKRDRGESAEVCRKWVEANAYCVNSFFTVEDLKYLRKGGRVSAVLAIAGSLLNIKPILRADGSRPAKIAFYARERGRKRALRALADEYAKFAVDPGQHVAYIAHGDCEQDALEVADMVRALGAKDVVLEYYDLCTGSHVGPGTVALFFWGKDRRTVK